MGLIQKADDWFATTRIAKFFEMNERKTSLSTELGGATVTFMTMAYILAVNPRILADSGGPCVPNPDEPEGIFGPTYNNCVEQVSCVENR